MAIHMLSLEIENGTIGIDYKLSTAGELVLVLKCESVLREDVLVRYTMGYEIEFKYLPKDNSVPQEEYAYDEFFDWIKENKEVVIGGCVCADNSYNSSDNGTNWRYVCSHNPISSNCSGGSIYIMIKEDRNSQVRTMSDLWIKTVIYF